MNEEKYEDWEKLQRKEYHPELEGKVVPAPPSRIGARIDQLHRAARQSAKNNANRERNMLDRQNKR